MKNSKIKNFKISKLLSLIRVKARQTDKMFALSLAHLGVKRSTFAAAYRKILFFSFGRVSGLSNRVHLIQQFVSMLMRLKKAHGSDFVVKWLKACYVALQKALAGDNLSSLRVLEPHLPMPRLINGLPAFIKSTDRQLIKQGHSGVIIFWSSLFSVYRVLKVSYKIKVASITEPFKGNEFLMNFLLQDSYNPFAALKGYKGWMKSAVLAPRTFLMSSKSSPSNKVSWQGLLGEVMALVRTWGDERGSSSILENLEDYLNILEGAGHNTQPFRHRLNEMRLLGERFEELLFEFPEKPSCTNHWGQFSLKEEAAGKLRVFAIVDGITQSVLSPLHKELFNLIKKIPNDGTFNQDESVKRLQIKAQKAQCAFSFDLSAATDRLPANLSAKILSKIFRINGLGEAWLKYLVERDYFFSPKQWKKYCEPQGIPKSLRYSVGQPMGALSSWAMLAITHHYMLQWAALNVGLIKSDEWCESYEILGDDLVVTNEKLANEYLRIAILLGVEINLTKSIVSPNKPVFEFAKRTCWGEVNLSPIAFKQLLGTSLADTTGNFLAWASRGLLKSNSLLLACLSRFGIVRADFSVHAVPLLASLGALVHKNLVPHRWLIESLVDPSNSEFDFESAPFKFPLASSLKLTLDTIHKWNLSEGDKGSEKVDYPFSQQEIREEFYDDYEDEFANVIANRALTLAKVLENEYDTHLESNAMSWVDPTLLGPCKEKSVRENLIREKAKSDTGLLGALIGVFEANLLDWNKGLDPTEAVDEIETDPKFYYRHGLTIPHAEAMLAKVEKLNYKFILQTPSRSRTESASAGVIVTLNKVVKGVKQNYWKIERNSY